MAARMRIMANGAQEYKLLWESSAHADGDADLGPEGEVGEDADAVVGRGVDEADAEAVIAHTRTHTHTHTHTLTHTHKHTHTHANRNMHAPASAHVGSLAAMHAYPDTTRKHARVDTVSMHR